MANDANSPAQRLCPQICLATTGNQAYTVCRAGSASTSGYTVHGYSQSLKTTCVANGYRLVSRGLTAGVHLMEHDFA